MVYSFFASEDALYVSDDATEFHHGDSVVYRLYVDDVLAGTFTVAYVNENSATEVDVEQSFVYGSYYFAPVDLLGPDYKYEIIGRPGTLGGLAPWINIHGQFEFAHQVMPVNISRAGEYIVKASDHNGNVVAVYIITIL